MLTLDVTTVADIDQCALSPDRISAIRFAWDVSFFSIVKLGFTGVYIFVLFLL